MKKDIIVVSIHFIFIHLIQYINRAITMSSLEFSLIISICLFVIRRYAILQNLFLRNREMINLNTFAYLDHQI